MKNWKNNSWRKYPVKHIPEYPDKKELDQVLGKIKIFPHLFLQEKLDTLNNSLQTLLMEKLFFYKVEIVQKVLQNFILTISEIHLN